MVDDIYCTTNAEADEDLMYHSSITDEMLNECDIVYNTQQNLENYKALVNYMYEILKIIREEYEPSNKFLADNIDRAIKDAFKLLSVTNNK